MTNVFFGKNKQFNAVFAYLQTVCWSSGVHTLVIVNITTWNSWNVGQWMLDLYSYVCEQSSVIVGVHTLVDWNTTTWIN